MKNITKISLIAVLFALTPVLSVLAANNYATSGLCIGQSSNYGSSFFDVSAGTVNINGSNYNTEAIRGLLAENNSVIEVYAYKNAGTNKITIGTLVNNINSNFKNNGVLIGKVYTGIEASNRGSSVTKFESYVSGCSGNVAISINNQNTGILALNDTINTSSKLNVRSNPSGTAGILGKVNSGATGVVVDGPVISGSYSWWKVQYNSGLVGWSAGDWLSKNASVATYVAETSASAPATNTNVVQSSANSASVEQMASALEAAKALLEQLTNSLRAIQN